MSDPINTNQYLEILKPDEQAAIRDAEKFISTPIPVNAGERPIYAYHNLRIQNDLNSLRGNVDWARQGLINRMRKRENDLRRDARDDGVRDKDERNAYCYTNAQWRDLNDSVQRLSLISDRLKSLEWILKSSLSFVERMQ